MPAIFRTTADLSLLPGPLLINGVLVTTIQLDETHDPARKSWVESANKPDCDFPIQNLPFGVFRTNGQGNARIGVAIGDVILDLGAIASQFDGQIDNARDLLQADSLRPLMAQSPTVWTALRKALGRMLESGSASRSICEPHLVPIAQAEMLMPVTPGGFVDFYASIQHATNAGSLFRPTAPLLPNYKHIPIGYNGRASTIRIGGGEIRRPNGQRKAADKDMPDFGPSQRLDYEMEIGIFLGNSTQIGSPVTITDAWQHIFGFCILNDWSARDIQAWEYQPLGPFLGKSFATSISPWIVTADALRPFHAAAFDRAAGDPKPMPYLFDEHDQKNGAVDIEIETWFRSGRMAANGQSPIRLSAASAAKLYWTPAQMVTHQTSNGCNIEAGDLYGTGTVSGETPDSLGSLLEITRGGAEPLTLPDGSTRTFLDDGDEVTMKARCRRNGFVTIGFGRCSGRVVGAPT